MQIFLPLLIYPGIWLTLLFRPLLKKVFRVTDGFGELGLMIIASCIFGVLTYIGLGVACILLWPIMGWKSILLTVFLAFVANGVGLLLFYMRK